MPSVFAHAQLFGGVEKRLRSRGRLRWVGRPGMMFMEIKRNFMTQRVVGRDSFLEEPFLNIAWKIRPKPQCSLSNNMRKSSGVAGHAFALQKLDSGDWTLRF
jgi:hypothetical protein